MTEYLRFSQKHPKILKILNTWESTNIDLAEKLMLGVGMGHLHARNQIIFEYALIKHFDYSKYIDTRKHFDLISQDKPSDMMIKIDEWEHQDFMNRRSFSTHQIFAANYGMGI